MLFVFLIIYNTISYWHSNFWHSSVQDCAILACDLRWFLWSSVNCFLFMSARIKLQCLPLLQYQFWILRYFIQGYICLLNETIPLKILYCCPFCKFIYSYIVFSNICKEDNFRDSQCLMDSCNMLDFAYLDNQDIVLGNGNLESPVTFGFNETVHRSYCFKLTAKLNVKIT